MRFLNVFVHNAAHFDYNVVLIVVHSISAVKLCLHHCANCSLQPEAQPILQNKFAAAWKRTFSHNFIQPQPSQLAIVTYIQLLHGLDCL